MKKSINHRAPKNRKTFTLIEILVVVAIIGILASLLMPVLGKARKTARNVLCMNNLRQLHLAIAMYADDNGGYVPDRSGLNNQVSWDDMLSGYDGREALEDEERNGHAFLKDTYGENYGIIYKCPFETPNATTPNMTYAFTRFSNTQDALGLMGTDAPRPHEVGKPALAIMLFEYPYSRCRLGWDNYNIKRATDQRALINGGTSMLHGPYKSNYLMADGHVEGLEIDATVVPFQANTWVTYDSLWDATK
ncbi:type II secretion system protein [Lentisphaera profundi]|uniref:Type II secretion system protein n=1 Tax=Lentisphaera profundi TaxID=1658616 RepID=A0ABY7VXH0_9BACT|nr:type II secretion system protein [Lentisphaera profundi]WDE98961.1 type II secretion system protein [Lentisphaera profundi]